MAKKFPKTKGSRKMGDVLEEFQRGTLKSSSGDLVTNPKQALAISLSEQREFDKKRRRRS